ncbi:MAG: PQQ-dependent sugar dehydrogenase, partial [Arenicellales bacterium]|nr:PQQ-dependent sugar dehydrogenase [Arenicellales bacterium]
MLSVRSRVRQLSGLFLCLGVMSSGWADSATVFESQRASFRVVTLASGLEHPWALAFLPSGDMLVTERPGTLRVIHDGQVLESPVTGLPEVSAGGQGGLLDVALDPAFVSNRRL